MPYAITSDNVRLYYEEVGQGAPVVFVHEFAGDHRSWEPQMREFGKRYRCITYAARGYTPSDVPDDADAYSYLHVMRDCVAVLDHLKLDSAHLVGLSMGGYTVLQVALNHPARVRSMTLAGAGSGSERWYTQDFHKTSRALGDQFERDGSAAVACGTVHADRSPAAAGRFGFSGGASVWPRLSMVPGRVTLGPQSRSMSSSSMTSVMRRRAAIASSLSRFPCTIARARSWASTTSDWTSRSISSAVCSE